MKGYRTLPESAPTVGTIQLVNLLGPRSAFSLWGGGSSWCQNFYKADIFHNDHPTWCPYSILNLAGFRRRIHELLHQSGWGRRSRTVIGMMSIPSKWWKVHLLHHRSLITIPLPSTILFGPWSKPVAPFISQDMCLGAVCRTPQGTVLMNSSECYKSLHRITGITRNYIASKGSHILSSWTVARPVPVVMSCGFWHSWRPCCSWGEYQL